MEVQQAHEEMHKHALRMQVKMIYDFIPSIGGNLEDGCEVSRNICQLLE